MKKQGTDILGVQQRLSDAAAEEEEEQEEEDVGSSARPDAGVDAGSSAHAGAGSSARLDAGAGYSARRDEPGAGSSARCDEPAAPPPSRHSRFLAILRSRRFKIIFESFGFTFLPGCLRVAATILLVQH